MTNYFFLGSLLPDLEFGLVPEMSYKELIPYLETNLTNKDKKKLQVLRRLFDLYHLRSLWKGEEEFSERGNFDENELEEAVLTKDGFPDYVFDFLDKNESNEEKLSKFSELLNSFFDEEIAASDGILQKILKLEKDSRLVMMAFRAKFYKRDLLKELSYENPDEEIVAEILAQKDSPSFEPPEPYEELKVLFDEYKENPLELQKAFLVWKFNKIRDFQGTDPFSIDRILSYVVRLFLVEKWNELDSEKGLKIVDAIIKRAK